MGRVVAGHGILGLGLGLAVVLGFLAAALQEMTLAPGRPLPATPPAIGGVVRFGDPEQLLSMLQIVVVILLVAVAVGTVIALLTPEGRVDLALRIAIGVAILGVAYIALAWLGTPTPIPEEVELSGERGPVPGEGLRVSGEVPPGEAMRPEAMPPEPPAWASSLVALVLAVLVAWWGWRWAGRGRSAASTDKAAESIAAAAADAAAQLRRGAGVAETVIECWVRMAEILSTRTGVANAPTLTAREFAEALARLGFREPAVRRLTELFEEVRYGRKAGEPRRDEALAALTAVEQAYGQS